MPIHTDWIDMIHSMDDEYPEGERKCYDLSNGKKICAHAKAWEVFFAKMNKERGRGGESRAKDRKVGESEDLTEVSDLEKDIYIEWYLKSGSGVN